MQEDTEYIDRQGQIEDLSNFITSKRQKLLDVVRRIGWSEEELGVERKLQCSVNPGHWVASSSFEKHIAQCKLLKEGYLKEDLEKQPPSSHFFYTNSTSTVPVLFGQEQLEEILAEVHDAEKTGIKRKIDHMPQTMDAYIAEFSTKERLAIYEYVVAKGKATNKPITTKVEDLMFDFQSSRNQDEDKPKTELELLAAQRDYKRRRQSYKAKKVHLTKKSYTEVIREVIENQTNFLSEMYKDERHDRSPEQDTRDASTSDGDGEEKKDYSRNHGYRRSRERDTRNVSISDEDREKKADQKDYSREYGYHRSREKDARNGSVSDGDREEKTHWKDYNRDHGHPRSRERRNFDSYDRHHSKHKKKRSRSRSPSDSHHRHKKHKKHKKHKHS